MPFLWTDCQALQLSTMYVQEDKLELKHLSKLRLQGRRVFALG